MSTKINGTFSAVGTSATAYILRRFNLSLTFSGTGTVSLQRSFDKGTTWQTTDTFTANKSTIGEEVEKNVLYRLNCTAIQASNTIIYRIGASGIS